jgi:GxxExxY protein
MVNDSINQLTEKIIGAAFRVHNTLGSGFKEKIYQRAMVVALKKLGLSVEEEFPLSISFDNEIIGTHRADLFVEKIVLVELKAILELGQADEVQLVNYLSATKIDNGLLINFGQSVQVKRKYRVYKKTG